MPNEFSRTGLPLGDQIFKLFKVFNTRRPVAVIFDRYVFIKIQAMFQKFF
jgi:hypothetical protein